MQVNPSGDLTYDLLAFIVGACVGSFLNVMALRSLKEQSFIWPASYCPNCNKSLQAFDNIPVLSYLFLGGKCRYCKNHISWQYPLVELATAVIFVLIERRFLFGFIPFQNVENQNMWAGISTAIQSLNAGQHVFDMPWDLKLGLTVGMLFLACTLIATCITDLREKLIPHEITYPSMLIGICFSAFIRHDLMGALAGIGVSYILFDFLAYYGLKFYMYLHRHDEETDESEEEEPVEVMGGGDAVLSAVIASYIGLQILAATLIVGFLVGTFVGLFLLFIEIKKASLIPQLINKARQLAAICLLGFGLFGFLFDCLIATSAAGAVNSHMALPLAALGALVGLLMATVSVGTQVSKPFPFGPALALGGFIAMFIIPNWVGFY